MISNILFPDGNFSIDFNVINTVGDTNQLTTTVYYSTIAGDLDNLIALDFNLLHMALNPQSDFNCSWGVNDGLDNGFASSRQCFIGFPISSVADGNHFVDFNISKASSDVLVLGFDSNWFVKSVVAVNWQFPPTAVIVSESTKTLST